MNRPALSGFKPDPEESAPLYLQLAKSLAEAIRGGLFQVDDALPSERVLAESLQVSRVTTRKAIDQLVEQGLIIRRHGSGNYIAPRAEPGVSQLGSLSEELAQRGYRSSSRWLGRLITDAAPDEQLRLGLSPGARVARLERLRLADEVVIAYEMSVLPQSVLPDPQGVDGSLYRHLEALKMAPVRALQRIRALNAPPRLAEQLAVPGGQALLFITRVAYLETGQAIELTRTWFRSDYYDVVVESRSAP